MINKKNKILVTGGAGYIGSHTVVELYKAGYEAIMIDNLSNSHKFIVDNISKITGSRPLFSKTDMCNKSKLEKFFMNNTDIGAVIHFAAYKDVGESVINPGKYYYNNLVSLINLLDLMEKYKIVNLIFSSSCTIYGEPTIMPITENATIIKPESPYGNTKKICEEIITDYSRSKNIQSVLLRYFNPTGADESAMIGELPLHAPSNLMPVITQTAIGKIPMFTVNGNDYPTQDGTPIRDYFHVSDCAKAHINAVEYLQDQKNNNAISVFNLGSEKGYSVLDVIKTFEKETGIKLNYKFGPRRKGDVVSIYADSSLAHKELGWKTGKTLAEMVKTAWEWEKYLKQNNLI